MKALGTVLGKKLGTDLGSVMPLPLTPDQSILALSPFSWMEASSYTESGGKVTAFLDRARVGHIFAQANASQQVATPVADATFNGALSATFVRLSVTSYTSSLPASDWRFLHNGAGMHVFMPVAMTIPGTAGVLWGTRISGEGMQTGNSANVFNIYAQNAAAGWVILADPIGTANTSAVCLTWRHGTSASPQWSLAKSGVVMSSAAYGAAPSNTGPNGTLHIGANGSGGGNGDFRTPGVLIFDRVLTVPEVATVSAALLAKYGTVA